MRCANILLMTIQSVINRAPGLIPASTDVDLHNEFLKLLA